MSKIFIRHDLHPEDNAMAQALYSRSPASFSEHYEKIKTVGSGQFMGKYYVGYGHASIGDCGSTTIFIEGVSMLAAKAVQDNPLYSGQEASTRYMNFAEASFDNPQGGTQGASIQERWMEFYHTAFPQVVEHVRAQHPQNKDESDAAYTGAVKARTFDILRAFLPAGTHTNLSWHTNLRQARDRLRMLIVHPSAEVRGLAQDLVAALSMQYPNSGFQFNFSSAAWEYNKKVAEEFTYVTDVKVPGPERVRIRYNFDYSRLHDPKILKLVAMRPPGALLPGILYGAGTLTTNFNLDFGSFRDLQRHRNGHNQMPLLTTRLGFHPWYLEQLPASLRPKAEELIMTQAMWIDDLSLHDAQKQSYIAMGFMVPCEVTQGLPAFAYRVELRSGPMIHATLRRIAHLEAAIFTQHNPEIPLHIDQTPSDWDVRRGTQTITSR